jgi:hypothetical protein
VKKLIIVVLTGFVLIAFQEKQIDWKALVPLVATRTQVEASLGAPTSGTGYVFAYDTRDEKVSVWYGGVKLLDKDACRWNVPDEILFKFVVAPKKVVPLSETNIDLTTFRREKAPEMVNDYYYYNEVDGVTITTRMVDGHEVLLGIERGPDLAQRKKYCCKEGHC